MVCGLSIPRILYLTIYVWNASMSLSPQQFLFLLCCIYIWYQWTYENKKLQVSNPIQYAPSQHYPKHKQKCYNTTIAITMHQTIPLMQGKVPLSPPISMHQKPLIPGLSISIQLTTWLILSKKLLLWSKLKWSERRNSQTPETSESMRYF